MSTDFDAPSGNDPAKKEFTDKKLAAGLCGILIGSLGIHRFILGDSTGGLIRIAITVVTCGAGGLIGFIEGIIYLTKSDDDFYQEYGVNKKGWF